MLELFVSEIPVAVTKIRKAYDSGDFETVRYSVHRIRPSILNMGINRLKDEVTEIEELSMKEEKTPQLDAMIGKLETVIGEVVNAIEHAEKQE